VNICRLRAALTMLVSNKENGVAPPPYFNWSLLEPSLTTATGNLLRELAYAVYELEGFAKVGKREGLRKVVFFDDVPAVHLLFEGGKLLTP
jgi:hypothetical protein